MKTLKPPAFSRILVTLVGAASAAAAPLCGGARTRGTSDGGSTTGAVDVGGVAGV